MYIKVITTFIIAFKNIEVTLNYFGQLFTCLFDKSQNESNDEFRINL